MPSDCCCFIRRQVSSTCVCICETDSTLRGFGPSGQYMCLIFPPGLSLCLSLNVAFCVPFLDNALHIQKRHPVGIWKHSYQLHGPPYLLPPLFYVLLLFHVETEFFLKINLNIYIYTQIITLSDVTQKEIVICMISMKDQYLQASKNQGLLLFLFYF